MADPEADEEHSQIVDYMARKNLLFNFIDGEKVSRIFFNVEEWLWDK